MNDKPVETEIRDTPPADAPADAPGADVDDLWDALRRVYDPELHMNLVDLGLIYGVAIEEGVAKIDMTLTSPGCPYGPYLLHDVDRNVRSLAGIADVLIKIVWDPPWGPEKMSMEARLELGFDV